jgi:Mrp family chromosome partitioning ATPase
MSSTDSRPHLLREGRQTHEASPYSLDVPADRGASRTTRSAPRGRQTARRSVVLGPVEGTTDRSVGYWLQVLRDGLIGFLAVLGLCVALAVLSVQGQPTRYAADATLVVSPAGGFLETSGADALPAMTDTVGRLTGTVDVLEQAAQTYIAKAPDAETRAAREQTATVPWMREHYSWIQPSSSNTLTITGIGDTDLDARHIAESVVDAIVAAVNVQNNANANTDVAAQGLRIRVFSLAEPKGQISPTPVRTVLLGMIAGIVLGIVVALIIGTLRRRVRVPSELADELDTPLLGVVRRARWTGLAADPGIAAARARLVEPLSRNGRPGGHVLLVTGPIEERDLAAVSLGLAQAFGRAGRRTVLIDGDLSGREATRQLGLDAHNGLGELLLGEFGLDDDRDALSGSLVEPFDAIDAIPAGAERDDPAAMLSRPELAPVISRLRDVYDVVVLSAPPVGRAAETISLLQAADLAVVVAPSGISKRALQDGCRLGEPLQRRLVGTLVVG